MQKTRETARKRKENYMTKQVTAAKKRIERAFCGVSSLVQKNVRALVKEEDADVKKLKEISSVAKELFGIIKAAEALLPEEGAGKVTLCFEGGDEEWGN